MKDRPILFSAPMVRAVLDGSKRQTRRIAKPMKDRDLGCLLAPCELAGEINVGKYRNSKYGQPGDRLWVRETWGYNPDFPGLLAHVCYRADPGHEYDGMIWRPSIHMPRQASRITLEIGGLRVEKLQDISEADAQAEGAAPIEIPAMTPAERGLLDLPLMEIDHPYRNGFAQLWETINGAGSWALNPWCWVLEFRRIEA